MPSTTSQNLDTPKSRFICYYLAAPVKGGFQELLTHPMLLQPLPSLLPFLIRTACLCHGSPFAHYHRRNSIMNPKAMHAGCHRNDIHFMEALKGIKCKVHSGPLFVPVTTSTSE